MGEYAPHAVMYLDYTGRRISFCPYEPVHARDVLFLDREGVMYVRSHWEAPSIFTAATVVARVAPTSNPRLPDVLDNTGHFFSCSQAKL